MVVQATAQFDSHHDIAPLVAAAELDPAIVVPVEYREVIGLQNHVVEFNKRQTFLHAQLDRLLRQHAIDAEVPTDLAEEVDVLEIPHPRRVVHEQGSPAHLAALEIDEPCELPTDGLEIGPNLVLVEEFPHLGLAARITDQGGRPTDHGDGPMPMALEVGQGEDRNEVPDVQGIRGGVEAGITGRGRSLEQRGQRRLVGHLVDEPSTLHLFEEPTHAASPGLSIRKSLIV